MNIRDIKTLVLASALSMFSVAGLSSCNTGTDPGDTNTERSGIRDEGDMVGGTDDDPMGRYSDTTKMEDHYDHTKNKKASSVYAGDGKEEGVGRDNVKKQ